MNQLYLEKKFNVKKNEQQVSYILFSVTGLGRQARSVDITLGRAMARPQGEGEGLGLLAKVR